MLYIYYLAMRIMILIGSFTIVMRNIANGGPKAINAHPKNSYRAIVILYFEKSYPKQ